MPFEVDEDRDATPRIVVRPSAVLELTWLVGLLEWRDKGIELPQAVQAAAPALLEELRSVWGDGAGGCVPDTSILAERIGALLSDEVEPFLEGLDRAARTGGAGLELRSESPEDRALTLERLNRLHDDPELVRRYRRALARIWGLVRDEWEENGRATVRRASREWEERLRSGASALDMLPEKHVARKPRCRALLDERPLVVLSPMYFATTGGFVVDMTSYVHVGGPVRPADPERRRRESELIAGRFKLLADGTRVAIVRDLAQEPASVMDLARRFQLAQPTVSNHVRLLKDAGLLESQRDGARVLYRVPRERLGQLLTDTQHLLLEH